MSSRKLSLPIRLSLALFALTALAQPPSTSCDPDLLRQTSPGDPDRYKDRGNRCEGLYAEQVSYTGNLLVASLTSGVGTPTAWTAKPLTLQCKYKTPSDIHLQAFLLQPRPFYRLDVVQRAADLSWNWNTEVIARYARPVNVGVVAWTIAVIDGRPQRIYLPVRNPANPAGLLKLIVLPPVPVTEAYLTVASTTPGEKPLRNQTPLGKGSYQKNERIEIDLPPLPHEGLYSVEVAGRSGTGSVFAPPFLIYSDGK